MALLYAAPPPAGSFRWAQPFGMAVISSGMSGSLMAVFLWSFSAFPSTFQRKKKKKRKAAIVGKAFIGSIQNDIVALYR